MDLSNLVEIAQHLATNLLTTRLLVIHDARRRREDDDTKQTRGQKTTNPVLEVVVGQIVTRAVIRKQRLVSLRSYVSR